jgi:hypothetical protein
MIEKKITYDINIEKPSKTKPVKQGGVLNYLGKQKTVNAPVKWRSSKDHPIAHLSYITKDEEKILIDLNLYGSLKGKPNRGPFGLPSLQGSGGGSGGDGGGGDGGGGGDSGGDSGQGDSGPGGSDDGSGHGGPGQGDSGPGGSDDGTGHGGPGPGADSDSGSMGGIGMGDVGGLGVSDSSGMSVGDVAGTSDNSGMGGVAGSAVGAAATAAAAESNTGVMSTLANIANRAVQNAINNPVATAIGIAMGPVAGLAARGISAAVDAANRGVTGPSDDTQESSSVQSGPSQSPGGDGGITTLPQYAPLYNQATGDPLLDSLIARYRANLPPSSFGI